MKTKQLQWAGILMVMLFTFFAANVYADQASDDAGVKKETMLDLLEKGGPIMYPLGLGSLLALALGLERFISLRKQRVLPAGFIDNLMAAQKSDPSGQSAVANCDETGGAVGQIRAKFPEIY